MPLVHGRARPRGSARFRSGRRAQPACACRRPGSQGAGHQPLQPHPPIHPLRDVGSCDDRRRIVRVRAPSPSPGFNSRPARGCCELAGAQRRAGCSVHALLLGETLLLIPEVRQYQLSPQSGRLQVRVVLREGALKAAVLPSVRRAMETELDRLGATVDMLTVEAVDEIRQGGRR